MTSISLGRFLSIAFPKQSLIVGAVNLYVCVWGRGWVRGGGSEVEAGFKKEGYKRESELADQQMESAESKRQRLLP